MTGQMTELEAAGEGMRLAQALLNAKADQDTDTALWAINTASDYATKWALSYMTECVVSAVAMKVGHKPVRLALALRAAASGIDIDILENQLHLLSNDLEGGTS